MTDTPLDETGLLAAHAIVNEEHASPDWLERAITAYLEVAVRPSLQPVHWLRWAVLSPEGEPRRYCLTEGQACETACGDEDVMEVAIYPVDAVTPEDVQCLRMMIDYAECWIDFKCLGEWEEHKRAKDALAALTGGHP